jgi:hypothetical protein
VLNVAMCLTLLVFGVYGIPASFKLMDNHAKVRAERRAELEQLRFESSRKEAS